MRHEHECETRRGDFRSLGCVILPVVIRRQERSVGVAQLQDHEFVAAQSTHDFSAAHTRMSVERSLQRLETDFIDLVLVHSDGNDLAILNDSEVYATLAALKAEGKIRGFGFSGQHVFPGDCRGGGAHGR